MPRRCPIPQANGIVFRVRDLLVRQRTQCVNALRGHLLEYGYVFPQGISHVADVVAAIEDPQSCLPESMRTILQLLVDTFTALEAQIAVLDTEINRRSKADPTARRLVWERLEVLREEAGTTVLVTTHQMEEAERQCDRIALMDRGRIAALGSPGELRSRFGVPALEDVFTEVTGGRLEEGGSFRDVRASRRRSRRLG